MKTKFLLLATMGVALNFPAQAEIFNDIYVSGKIGVTRTSESDYKESQNSGDIGVDNTINFAGAVGVNVTPNIRTELELSYRDADLDDISIDGVGSANVTGHIKTWGALFNGYYDFMEEKAFSPYVTAGFGLIRHSADIDAIAGIGVPDSNGNDTSFAYQAGFGGAYDLSEEMALDAGYRYLGSSDIKIDATKAEYDAHEFRVGVRYSF